MVHLSRAWGQRRWRCPVHGKYWQEDISDPLSGGCHPACFCSNQKLVRRGRAAWKLVVKTRLSALARKLGSCVRAVGKRLWGLIKCLKLFYPSLAPTFITGSFAFPTGFCQALPEDLRFDVSMKTARKRSVLTKASHSSPSPNSQVQL